MKKQNSFLSFVLPTTVGGSISLQIGSEHRLDLDPDSTKSLVNCSLRLLNLLCSVAGAEKSPLVQFKAVGYCTQLQLVELAIQLAKSDILDRLVASDHMIRSYGTSPDQFGRMVNGIVREEYQKFRMPEGGEIESRRKELRAWTKFLEEHNLGIHLEGCQSLYPTIEFRP